MTERERYARAAVLARAAMGKDKRGDYVADTDPLAWWCLTEAIAELNKSPLSRHAPRVKLPA